MVAGMAPGSVIVDLAAERGGNCEFTQAGKVIVEHGVRSSAYSTWPLPCPTMRARCMQRISRRSSRTWLRRKLQLNLEDEIIQSTLVTLGGEVVNARCGNSSRCRLWWPSRRRQECDEDGLITSLYVFMLAGFIGFEVIRRVSPLLHTPLMSLTNALDAIAVVGAILLAENTRPRCPRCSVPSPLSPPPAMLWGGFLITDRMLKMFKASRNPKP